MLVLVCADRKGAAYCSLACQPRIIAAGASTKGNAGTHRPASATALPLGRYYHLGGGGGIHESRHDRRPTAFRPQRRAVWKTAAAV